MSTQKFFICEICGNLVGLILDKGGTLVCCGAEMKELKANTVDAAQEKHVPVVKIEDNKVIVNVGSVDHPMTPEHYIQFIYIQTENGGHKHMLFPSDKPHSEFCICADKKVIAVYEYCNLHGLWKTTV